MTEDATVAFFSYCRGDSDFALRLAADLKAAGARVWIDQLDLVPGERWDRTVEDALKNCARMLVLLSPASVDSTNVMDEVNLALEKQKTVIPVIYKDCEVPFRLRRLQHVDVRQDYVRGLKDLVKVLAPSHAEQSTRSFSDVRSQVENETSDRDKPSEDARRKGVRRTVKQPERLSDQRAALKRHEAEVKDPERLKFAGKVEGAEVEHVARQNATQVPSTMVPSTIFGGVVARAEPEAEAGSSGDRGPLFYVLGMLGVIGMLAALWSLAGLAGLVPPTFGSGSGDMAESMWPFELAFGAFCLWKAFHLKGHQDGL
jgi:hypothetical protein